MLSSLSYIPGGERLGDETTSGAKRLVGAKRQGGKRLGTTSVGTILWCYHGRCGLVPDSTITNKIDQSQPLLEAFITEEFYQTNHGSYHTYGMGSFDNGHSYLQYRRALL